MHKRIWCLAMVIGLLGPSVCEAGIGSIDADHPARFSAEDNCRVIVARVDRVWVGKSDDGRPRDRAVLIPLATIAGPFDPTAVERLEVELYSRPPTSSIPEAPKAGAIVLAVVRVGALVHDDPKPRNVVPSEYCAFMPKEAALVTVSGLGDPVIVETAERIRKARAAARARQARDRAGKAGEGK